MYEDFLFLNYFLHQCQFSRIEDLGPLDRIYSIQKPMIEAASANLELCLPSIQGFYLKEAMIRQLLASVPGADFADDQVKEGLVRNFLQGDALAPK